MSYDAKTDKMDWRKELSWMVISFFSGLILSVMFIYFNRFPGANDVLLITVCCVSFYLLSILIRIQNHRGKTLTGKTGMNEWILKFVFPIFGLGLGLALLFLQQ